MDLSLNKKSDLTWNYIGNFFEEYCLLLQNLFFFVDNDNVSIPVILLHDTGIYAILETEFMNSYSLVDYLTKIHKSLQESLGVAPSCITLLSFSYKENVQNLPEDFDSSNLLDRDLFVYDFYSGIELYDSFKFFDIILSEFESRTNRFSKEDIYNYSDILGLKQIESNPESVGNIFEKDGTTYVIRKGLLHEASDCDSDLNFYLTLFGGGLGIHKFYQRKWLKGFVYLITCGFCGVGWLFDILENLLGITRDSDKYYLLPVNNRKLKILISLLGPVCIILSVKLYLRLYDFLLLLITPLLNEIIGVLSGMFN